MIINVVTNKLETSVNDFNRFLDIITIQKIRRDRYCLCNT